MRVWGARAQLVGLSAVVMFLVGVPVVRELVAPQVARWLGPARGSVPEGMSPSEEVAQLAGIDCAGMTASTQSSTAAPPVSLLALFAREDDATAARWEVASAVAPMEAPRRLAGNLWAYGFATEADPRLAAAAAVLSRRARRVFIDDARAPFAPFLVELECTAGRPEDAQRLKAELEARATGGSGDGLPPLDLESSAGRVNASSEHLRGSKLRFDHASGGLPELLWRLCEGGCGTDLAIDLVPLGSR